jgi:hypothetical protein
VYIKLEMSREDEYYGYLLDGKNEELNELEKKVDELNEVISKYEKYLNETYGDHITFRNDDK